MAQLQRLVIIPEQRQEEKISLTSEQKHYLLRVLRLEKGAKFIALDGEGNSWLVRLKGEEAEIIQSWSEQKELSVAITLMVALPKAAAFELIIRSGTELGVVNFVPLISERTLLKPSANKLSRWRKIAREAAEQSERQLVPTIEEPVKFIKSLGKTETQEVFTRKYICVARTEETHLLNSLMTSPSQPGQEIFLATGPEGGWTSKEVTAAIASGFEVVSLGKRILRAVTAPLVALSLITGAMEAEK